MPYYNEITILENAATSIEAIAYGFNGPQWPKFITEQILQTSALLRSQAETVRQVIELTEKLEAAQEEIATNQVWSNMSEKEKDEVLRKL